MSTIYFRAQPCALLPIAARVPVMGTWEPMRYLGGKSRLGGQIVRAILDDLGVQRLGVVVQDRTHDSPAESGLSAEVSHRRHVPINGTHAARGKSAHGWARK
jgi:uncharacterized Zn-binding protein involved in type VI secretion